MTAIHTNITNKTIIFVIHQASRLLIAILSFIGLSLDSYQLSDCFFGLSIILWVWLPEFDKIEENFFLKKSVRNNLATKN